MEDTNESVLESIRLLVETWCDRRSLIALRHVLCGYPLSSPLTDGWGDLLAALENVRAFAKEELTAEELTKLNDLIGLVSKAIYR